MSCMQNRAALGYAAKIKYRKHLILLERRKYDLLLFYKIPTVEPFNRSASLVNLFTESVFLTAMARALV